MKTIFFCVFSIIFFTGNGVNLTQFTQSTLLFSNPVSRVFKFDDEPRLIRGTVKKPSFDILSGVTINLFTSGGTSIISSTTSNSSGIFAIEQILPGSYQLVISFTGYETQTIDITVTNSDLDLEIIMN